LGAVHKWSELTGHLKDCGKDRPNSRTNSLQQGENDVVRNMRKLTFMSFNKEDVNSRANSVQPGKDDVDQDAWEYFRKTKVDASVKTPRKIVTLAQMRAATEACPDNPSARPDPFSREGVKMPLSEPRSDPIWTLC
jgi:hypothetical protein